jgi:peptide/nickel transport system substrate-binding protein
MNAYGHAPMGRRWIRIGVVGLLAVALLGLVATAAGGQESTTTTAAGGGEQVTLTVGLTQEIDSPNVTVGYTVAAYEVWNLQYATLTDKAADDFETIPGLAESWEGSDDGLTYTYTLREGLQWSDGEPLTADDVAYTINRSRDEEWFNHYATTANLEATAIDDVTLEITSSVPDPKLPTMDVYIVPQHIYEAIPADDLGTYEATDGVASGPYSLTELNRGQDWIMEANPNYWGWQGEDPAIDRVIFRLFTNPDAMVTALEQGEIDAAHDVPSSSFARLEESEDIVAVQGQQGGFDELAINAGAGGIGDGHPALEDVAVRQAIAHAVDKETIVSRVLNGLGEPADAMSPSPDTSWRPEIEDPFEFDLDRANQILDDAGYEDTDGNGVREMPGGGDELRFRWAVRTESDIAQPIYELVSGSLAEIGIETEVESYNDTQLGPVIGRGNWDLFVWGWTPFVDPDPQLSYFTCDQVSTNPDEPLDYYNDANWCSEEYDALYEEQNQELDRERREEIVHEMLTLFYEDAAYVVLDYSPDLQAYRTDRFEGWVRQPSEIGPVLFSNTSPTYALLQPVSEEASGGGDGGDGGSNTGLIVALAVLGVLVVGGGAFLLGRRGSVEDRE